MPAWSRRMQESHTTPAEGRPVDPELRSGVDAHVRGRSWSRVSMPRFSVLNRFLKPRPEPSSQPTINWTSLFCWGLFALALYWVYGNRPLVAQPWQWADDGLFLRQAEAIERHWSGRGSLWLGDYDGRILTKAPFLALTIASCHVFGLPFRLLEFVAFLALPWIFRQAMAPVVRLSMRAMVAVTIVLTAWPCLPIEVRLLRTPLHMLAASLCLIAATGLLLRFRLPMRRQLSWAVLLGLAAAAGYLNREEITLVGPYIGMAMLVTLVAGWRSGRRAAALLPLVTAMGVAAVPIATVSYLNYRDYGLFGTTMRRAPQFVHLFHLLTRLDPQDRLRYVPIRTSTREKVYAVSPTFARLRPMLEGAPTDHLARNPGHLSRGGFPPDGREFFVTSFEWALRDATFLAGTKNAREVEAFYARCSREIEAAIAQNKIPAGPAGPALVCPPLPGDYSRIGMASWRLLKSVYFLEGETMPSPPVSSGVTSDVLRMGEICGATLAPLKARVHACFEAGALATGCKAEIQWGITDYLDLKTNWPMAEAYKKNAQALGRDFFPVEHIPPGFAGSTDMGNVSHRVPSIHPMLAVAPPNVIIHNPEFARWAASEQGDAAVIDGAKSLAFTAIDLMCDADLMKSATSDFAATAELSRNAVAKIREHGHVHGGCGCA